MLYTITNISIIPNYLKLDHCLKFTKNSYLQIKVIIFKFNDICLHVQKYNLKTVMKFDIFNLKWFTIPDMIEERK